ncbi:MULTISPECIES: ABC transporter ATP-binding protein [Hyphobacterium]|uniref:ABC transporter ATP-binding protein n=1 Tax=Hyphobacterium vulgare TaxID=1736751 RepID=A0ABV6ZUQ1_9PROT
MTRPLLSVRDARFLRGRREILSGVDLDLPQGGIVALLGPSGSGKTTLLRAIAGLERLDGGEISTPSGILDNQTAWVPPNRRGFGLVFQDGALFPHMTAVMNTAFGLNHLAGKARRDEAMIWLDRVGLAHRAHAYPHELSGGEQQRVALARALAPGPRLILLDEPFSSLDRSLRDDLRRSTAKLLAASGISALLVTHDAEEAMEMAETIILMQEGRIVQAGPPEALYARPNSRAAARLLGPANIWTGTVREGGLDSPIGHVEAPDIPDGETAHLIVRPERTRVGSGDTFTLVTRTFRGGAVDLVTFAPDGSEWCARVAPDGLPESERAGLSASPSDVVIVRD